MYKIYQNNTGKGYEIDEFSKKMIKICNEHKRKGKALAFAFILYDFRNPHFTKMLNDRDYWLAFNEISGNFLSIFSFDYKINNIDKDRQLDSYGLLTPIQVSSNHSKSTNTLIKKYFESELPLTFPAVLFFQVDNDEILDSLLIELYEEQIELAFIELKKYIEKAVKALNKIDPENKKNIQEIFNCLENEVKSEKVNRKIKRITKNAGGIMGLISSIKEIL